MNIENMTRQQFKDLPCRKWDEDIGEFSGLVILPTNRKHNSGWGVMDFVACKGTTPICRISGCTDDLKLNPCLKFWNIDMLYKSKLLHIWANNKMIISDALSSMDLKQVVT